MLKPFARIIFVLMTIKEADVTRSHQSRSKPPEGLEPGVNFKHIMDQVLMNMVSFLKRSLLVARWCLAASIIIWYPKLKQNTIIVIPDFTIFTRKFTAVSVVESWSYQSKSRNNYELNKKLFILKKSLFKKCPDTFSLELSQFKFVTGDPILRLEKSSESNP